MTDYVYWAHKGSCVVRKVACVRRSETTVVVMRNDVEAEVEEPIVKRNGRYHDTWEAARQDLLVQMRVTVGEAASELGRTIAALGALESMVDGDGCAETTAEQVVEVAG